MQHVLPPLPDTLPKGEGAMGSTIVCLLSLWERVGETGRWGRRLCAPSPLGRGPGRRSRHG